MSASSARTVAELEADEGDKNRQLERDIANAKAGSSAQNALEKRHFNLREDRIDDRNRIVKDMEAYLLETEKDFDARVAAATDKGDELPDRFAQDRHQDAARIVISMISQMTPGDTITRDDVLKEFAKSHRSILLAATSGDDPGAMAEIERSIDEVLRRANQINTGLETKPAESDFSKKAREYLDAPLEVASTPPDDSGAPPDDEQLTDGTFVRDDGSDGLLTTLGDLPPQQFIRHKVIKKYIDKKVDDWMKPSSEMTSNEIRPWLEKHLRVWRAFDTDIHDALVDELNRRMKVAQRRRSGAG